MAGVIVCYRVAWAVLAGLAAQPPCAVQSCAFLCLWPRKSMWSHWESVRLGRSAGSTHHAEIILDWLPWGVISHLLTQWGFMTTTAEIHSFVYGCCPCCGNKSPFHLSWIPLTFYSRCSTWTTSVLITSPSHERKERGRKHTLVSVSWICESEINFLVQSTGNKIIFPIHAYKYD